MAYKPPKYGQDDPYAPPQPEGPAPPNPNDPNAPIAPAPPTVYQGTDDPTKDPTSPWYKPPVAPAAPFTGTPQFPTPDPNAWVDADAKRRAAYDAANVDPTQPIAPTLPPPPTTTTPTTTTPPTGPSGYQAAMQGFDPTKLANLQHTTPKYVVARVLQGYPPTPAGLQQALPALQQAIPGLYQIGDDKIFVPGVGVVDVGLSFGAGGNVGWWWGDQGAGTPQTGAEGMTTSPLGTGSALTSSTASSAMQPWYQQGMTPSTSSTTGSTTATSGSSDPALEDARRAALLELLNRKPPTAEELQQSPENAAYQLQAQRAEERQRAELAERAAFEGFDQTGYFDTELQGIRQQRAEGEAGFLGELAVSRMQAQREDLQFAISEAQQAGQFDLAQQLQREAMNLDAAIRREQIASSDRQAANDLALREFLGKAGIDLDRLRLGETQRQFNYGYGLDVAELNQRDQIDLRNLLAGG